jgi:hypothetical protein
MPLDPGTALRHDDGREDDGPGDPDRDGSRLEAPLGEERQHGCHGHRREGDRPDGRAPNHEGNPGNRSGGDPDQEREIRGEAEPCVAIDRPHDVARRGRLGRELDGQPAADGPGDGQGDDGGPGPSRRGPFGVGLGEREAPTHEPHADQEHQPRRETDRGGHAEEVGPAGLGRHPRIPRRHDDGERRDGQPRGIQPASAGLRSGDRQRQRHEQEEDRGLLHEEREAEQQAGQDPSARTRRVGRERDDAAQREGSRQAVDERRAAPADHQRGDPEGDHDEPAGDDAGEPQGERGGQDEQDREPDLAEQDLCRGHTGDRREESGRNGEEGRPSRHGHPIGEDEAGAMPDRHRDRAVHRSIRPDQSRRGQQRDRQGDDDGRRPGDPRGDGRSDGIRA